MAWQMRGGEGSYRDIPSEDRWHVCAGMKWPPERLVKLC